MAAADAIDEEVARFKRELERQLLRLALDIQRRFGKGDALGAGIAAGIASDLADQYEARFRESLDGLRAGIARVLAEVADELEAAGVDPQLTTAAESTLRLQAGRLIDDLLRVVDEGKAALREAAIDYLRTTDHPAGALDAVAGAIGKSVAVAVSLVDTTISGIDRTAMVETAKDAGMEWVRYDGPMDSLTRDWCARRVGKVFRVDQLDDEPNDTGPQPPSQYGGGYNCRHRWVPLDETQARRYTRFDGEAWPDR